MEGKEKQPHSVPSATPLDDHEEIEYPLNYFRGIAFPGPPFDVEMFEQAVQYKPDPTDIFVATYPKCGTTWMQYVVWEIINKGLPPPSPNEILYHPDIFTHLELHGVVKSEKVQRPRLFKTHLPFHLVPYNPLAKYIYMVRNPWDACVSYYHYKRNFPKKIDLPFEKFIDYFIQGKVPYGEFFDNVLSWYEHKNDRNVLFLTYEDMSEDPKGALLTTAKFLGDDYYDVLKNDETVLHNCLKYSNFKYVKNLGMFKPKNANTTQSVFKDTVEHIRETMGSVSKDNVHSVNYEGWGFFRKGIVGDWKNFFTENQMCKFNDYIMAKVSGTKLEYTWTLHPDEIIAK